MNNGNKRYLNEEVHTAEFDSLNIKLNDESSPSINLKKKKLLNESSAVAIDQWQKDSAPPTTESSAQVTNERFNKEPKLEPT